MKRKSWEISLLLVATLFCCTMVSCSDDEPSKSTTETEPGPAEESNPTDESDNTINGYEYVDLGLSVMWATCNVGASSPEEYGDYFAWGEIEPKATYTERNSDTYEKRIADFAGNPKYDAATANWGSPWRMPTEDEIRELVDNCTTLWCSVTGFKGMLVTSNINGNSIFLPAAGARIGSSLSDAGEEGLYWSSSPYDYEDDMRYAYSLCFYYGYFRWEGDTRDIALSVRPVTTGTDSGSVQDPDPTTDTEHEYVDLGLSVKWATCNVGASSPEEYGDYYAWGEMETKETYTEENSVTYGKEMGDISGDPTYDVARAKWGGTWRIPTVNEILDLVLFCTAEWTTINGVKGYLFTSERNGNSIFIPAAGCRNIPGDLVYDGVRGYYWSSTPIEDNLEFTYKFEFDYYDDGSGGVYPPDGGDQRYKGECVRPVCD